MGQGVLRSLEELYHTLKFNNSSNTKFIGLSNLYIIAFYLNYKYKINDHKYILSILNYSKDTFVQIYQKKKDSNFFLENLSDIKNINLDFIENYLGTLNLSIQNVHSVYLGTNPNNLSFFNRIQLVNRSNILEIITKIFDLIENNKISQSDYKNFFEEKFDPIYGKLPLTS